MMWWVFNDLTDHHQSKGQALQIQVNSSCYVYRNVRMDPKDSNYVINRSLFFSFKVLNIGTNSLSDVKIGMYNDLDIGNYADDAVSCDSTESMVYAFNSDNLDEGLYNFGSNPPLMICKFLNLKMESFIAKTDLSLSQDYTKSCYALMRNSYVQGSQTIPYNEHFPSAFKPCQYTAGTTTSDRRFLMVADAADLDSDSTFTFDLAYILLHEPNTDYLQSKCSDPLHQARKIQFWYDQDKFPSESNWPVSISGKSSTGIHVYPNPAHLYVDIESDGAIIESVTLTDLSGKEILITKGSNEDLRINLSDLSSGIYILRIVTSEGLSFEKLIVE